MLNQNLARYSQEIQRKGDGSLHCYFNHQFQKKRLNELLDLVDHNDILFAITGNHCH